MYLCTASTYSTGLLKIGQIDYPPYACSEKNANENNNSCEMVTGIQESDGFIIALGDIEEYI